MTLTDGPNEYHLKDPPSDLISNITFSPNSNRHLLTSSWDTYVRLYDIVENSCRGRYSHSSPVLDCCFQNAVRLWSGDLAGELKVFDLSSGSEMDVGKHNAAIKCVEYCPERNLTVTGSWDRTLKLWDPRSEHSIYSTTLPNKVFTMSLCGSTLVVGTAGRQVLIFDIADLSYIHQRRESSLKYQTRCIRCFPNKQGYVLSSIEGRVAVEYLDPDAEVQRKKYAFKCHRVKENGIEMVYPVNTIAFHNGYNTFATGGSDGYVNIWDGFNRRRLCQFHQYPTQISSLAFSPDGQYIAIASSFIHESEPKDKVNQEHEIFIRTLTDQETKPK